MKMNPDEKWAAVDTLAKALEIVKKIDPVTDCLQCDHFTQEKKCDVFGEAPPESFYEEFCENWENIPI